MGRDPEERVFAQIYPVLREHIERIFDGKDIFCKYVSRMTTLISPGTKILLYTSASGRKVLGEATVKTVEFLNPNELIAKYDSRLFITEEELDEYRGNRPKEKPLLTLTIQKVKRYDSKNQIVLQKNVTMTGQKLSKEQYLELVRRSTNPSWTF